MDLPAGDSGSLVIVSKTRRFIANPLKKIIDKAVHDGHGLAGDTSVGVDLLQHLVDIDAVAFSSPPSSLLVPRSWGLCFADGFLGSLGTYFRWHDCVIIR